MLGYDINGLGNMQGGRGNIAPATLNLAYLGIKHGICLGKRETPDIEGFWKELDDMLKIEEESLLFRYEYIERWFKMKFTKELVNSYMKMVL